MIPEVSILIMDKDRATIKETACILETQGYHVTTACNWSQALHFLKSCFIDIAIIDRQTEDSDCRDVIAAMQSTHPDAMLIITTESADNHTIGELEKLGPYNIMIKPYDPFELICAIEFMAMELKRPAGKNLASSQ